MVIIYAGCIALYMLTIISGTTRIKDTLLANDNQCKVEYLIMNIALNNPKVLWVFPNNIEEKKIKITLKKRKENISIPGENV